MTAYRGSSVPLRMPTTEQDATARPETKAATLSSNVFSFATRMGYFPSILPILRSACFSASSLPSRSRKSSCGLRPPQSK